MDTVSNLEILIDILRESEAKAQATNVAYSEAEDDLRAVQEVIGKEIGINKE